MVKGWYGERQRHVAASRKGRLIADKTCPASVKLAVSKTDVPLTKDVIVYSTKSVKLSEIASRAGNVPSMRKYLDSKSPKNLPKVYFDGMKSVDSKRQLADFPAATAFDDGRGTQFIIIRPLIPKPKGKDFYKNLVKHEALHTSGWQKGEKGNEKYVFKKGGKYTPFG